MSVSKKELKTGQAAPDFNLPVDGGGYISLAQFAGRKLVIFFYPKDDTPGCTTQSCGFRDQQKEFENAGVQVIGLSKDSVKSHEKFKAKHNLNFPLASDEHSDTCEKYGVWAEKSMYGKKYMGIERTTFLIDEQGKIAQIWRNVKVPGHVEDVFKAAEGLRKAA